MEIKVYKIYIKAYMIDHCFNIVVKKEASKEEIKSHIKEYLNLVGIKEIKIEENSCSLLLNEILNTNVTEIINNKGYYTISTKIAK